KDDETDGNKTEEKNAKNEWKPFTNDKMEPVSIGRNKDNFWGASTVIGGSKNHLLFITYRPRNIAVFDLHQLQCIKYDTLPSVNSAFYHCFVSKMDNEKDKQSNKQEMILFCRDKGLEVQYDENSNTFYFETLAVCSSMRLLYSYAYVYVNVNDSILFFGGHTPDSDCSKAVHKYSITTKEWIKFEQTLPNPCFACFGIVSSDNKSVHLLGGRSEESSVSMMHMKTDVNEWMKTETALERQWLTEEKERHELEKLKIAIDQVESIVELKKLK
ncbi:hypothetical protein RFI_37542, partial [Reticulomyxa filosa]